MGEQKERYEQRINVERDVNIHLVRKLAEAKEQNREVGCFLKTLDAMVKKSQKEAKEAKVRTVCFGFFCAMYVVLCGCRIGLLSCVVHIVRCVV